MLLAIVLVVLFPVAEVTAEKLEWHSTQQAFDKYSDSLYKDRLTMGDVFDYPKENGSFNESKRLTLKDLKN